jgi:hypothetical protein
MQDYEPTLADWKAALESDRNILAGLQAIAKSKGPDPSRQANIEATKQRIREAKQNIARLKAQKNGDK